MPVDELGIFCCAMASLQQNRIVKQHPASFLDFFIFHR